MEKRKRRSSQNYHMMMMMMMMMLILILLSTLAGATVEPPNTPAEEKPKAYTFGKKRDEYYGKCWWDMNQPRGPPGTCADMYDKLIDPSHPLSFDCCFGILFLVRRECYLAMFEDNPPFTPEFGDQVQRWCWDTYV